MTVYECEFCGRGRFLNEHDFGCEKVWSKVGTAIVDADATSQQTYETASWYTDYKLDAGEYPVYQREYGSGVFVISAGGIPATIVKDYTPAGFGGHYYDNKDDREGERSAYRLSQQANLYSKLPQWKEDAFSFGTTGVKFLADEIAGETK